MKTIQAKVLDSTHLELSEPLATPRGEHIRIAVSEEPLDSVWREAAQQWLLDAYAKEDDIYEDL